MKLGNMIRDHKQQLLKNRAKVQKVKRERDSDNHVVALKNKQFSNNELELSTQRSS